MFWRHVLNQFSKFNLKCHFEQKLFLLITSVKSSKWAFLGCIWHCQDLLKVFLWMFAFSENFVQLEAITENRFPQISLAIVRFSKLKEMCRAKAIFGCTAIMSILLFGKALLSRRTISILYFEQRCKNKWHQRQARKKEENYDIRFVKFENGHNKCFCKVNWHKGWTAIFLAPCNALVRSSRFLQSATEINSLQVHKRNGFKMSFLSPQAVKNWNWISID